MQQNVIMAIGDYDFFSSRTWLMKLAVWRDCSGVIVNVDLTTRLSETLLFLIAHTEPISTIRHLCRLSGWITTTALLFLHVVSFYMKQAMHRSVCYGPFLMLWDRSILYLWSRMGTLQCREQSGWCGLTETIGSVYGTFSRTLYAICMMTT